MLTALRWQHFIHSVLYSNTLIILAFTVSTNKYSIDFSSVIKPRSTFFLEGKSGYLKKRLEINSFINTMSTTKCAELNFFSQRSQHLLEPLFNNKTKYEIFKGLLTSWIRWNKKQPIVNDIFTRKRRQFSLRNKTE